MFKFLKKKTDEEKRKHRVDELFLKLTCDNDFKFTDLEHVQIVNDLRRKLHESLVEKRSECLSQSTEKQQKAKEIENALSFIE